MRGPSIWRLLFVVGLAAGAPRVALAQLSPPATWAAHASNQYQIFPNIAYLTANNYEAELDVPAFNGSKSIYIQATSPFGSSNWQALESWTVASATLGITTISVTPSSGSGLQRTFAFRYSDSNGATDLTQVWLWFNTGLTFSHGANSCSIQFRGICTSCGRAARVSACVATAEQKKSWSKEADGNKERLS
jgi:hypothetical protein